MADDKHPVDVGSGGINGIEVSYAGRTVWISAEEIMKAFGEREIRDYEEHEFPESGAIDSNSHVRRFRSSRQKG